MSDAHGQNDDHHDEHGHDHHAPTSFWTKYVFSTDHKVIGLQFTFASLIFVIIGGLQRRPRSQPRSLAGRRHGRLHAELGQGRRGLAATDARRVRPQCDPSEIQREGRKAAQAADR